jgi:4-hydroxy-tetrahydrodipicolinate reductase
VPAATARWPARWTCLPALPSAQDATAFLGVASGVPITADLRQGLQNAEVLIDFTRPEGTLAHLAVCRELGVGPSSAPPVSPTRKRPRSPPMHSDIPIMMAPNMSVGVNVTLKLLEMAAKAMSTGYDIEIIEAHHRHKVDAPSGTALKMGEVIAGALGRDLKDCAVYAREGVTGERDPSSIGFATIRGGDIVGDHTVLFAGTGERIEITHKSSSRATYAQGSLRAVRFLAGRQAPWHVRHVRRAGFGVNVNTPLSGCAASPRSRSAVRCGQGDAPSAAVRPLRGSPGLGGDSCMRRGCRVRGMDH